MKTKGHVASKANMTAWAISDGRAGNQRQVRALLRALHLEAREFSVTLAAPWRWLAPHLRGPWPLALPGDLRDALGAPPGLVVGCGRASATLTALLRKHVDGCRAIQILDPRIAPRHFDWVIAPAHDGLVAPNSIATLGALNEVDDAWLSRAACDWPGLAAAPSPRLAVLLGGTHQDWDFDAPALDRLLKLVASWQYASGGSVWLTTSRRTPVHSEGRLRTFADARSRSAFFANPGSSPPQTSQGHLPQECERNPYAGYLALADCVLVTADSVNLASEACATGKPVFIFESTRARGKLARFHAALAARGHARDSAELLQPETAHWPPALREAAIVASMLREKLACLP